MTVTLSLKTTPRVPVEAESLIPKNVEGKDERDIGLLPLLVGNRQETVSDWFRVTVSEATANGDNKTDERPDLVLEGDLSRFKRLGQGMTRGRMLVEGPVGFHAGARMSGGSLTIHGDAGDYLGAHMTGGIIVVRGNAGRYAAAAYHGHNRGMDDGTIIITGNTGEMLGARMRRGLIFVLGDSGDATGFNMKAGTIIVGGTPGARVGARMIRGTVILLAGETTLLPTFSYACTYQPVFWRVYHKHLVALGFPPKAALDTIFMRYSGDANEGGRGEVFMRVR